MLCGRTELISLIKQCRFVVYHGISNGKIFKVVKIFEHGQDSKSELESVDGFI